MIRYSYRRVNDGDSRLRETTKESRERPRNFERTIVRTGFCACREHTIWASARNESGSVLLSETTNCDGDAFPFQMQGCLLFSPFSNNVLHVCPPPFSSTAWARDGAMSCVKGWRWGRSGRAAGVLCTILLGVHLMLWFYPSCAIFPCNVLVVCLVCTQCVKSQGRTIDAINHLISCSVSHKHYTRIDMCSAFLLVTEYIVSFHANNQARDHSSPS